MTVAGEKTRFPVPLPNLIAFCEPADGRGLEEGRAFLSLCAVQTFAFSACRRLGVGEEEKGSVRRQKNFEKKKKKCKNAARKA